MRKLGNVKKIFLYIYLFYLIYTPSIPGVIFTDKNITIPVLTLISVFHSLISRHNKTSTVKKTSLWFCLLILISNLYALIIYLLNNDFSIFESRLVQGNLVLCYFFLLSKIFYSKGKKIFDRKSALDIVANLAVFQGIFSLLSLMIPPLHNFSLSLYGGDNIFITSIRIFGISSDFTYATPIYHGFIAALLFYTGLKGEAKPISNFIKIALILLAVILNGRTGLVVFAVDLILFLIIYCVKHGRILKLIKYTILCGVIGVSGIFAVKNFLPNTYKFFGAFIENTYDYFVKDEAGGNYAILEKSATLPAGKDLIFGKGVRVYDAKNRGIDYTTSDIGYVNDLYVGGIIYATLLYSAYIYLLGTRIKDKAVLTSLIVTLFLANFKGEAFRSSILIFLMIYAAFMEDESEVKNG